MVKVYCGHFGSSSTEAELSGEALERVDYPRLRASPAASPGFTTGWRALGVAIQAN